MVKYDTNHALIELDFTVINVVINFPVEKKLNVLRKWYEMVNN